VMRSTFGFGAVVRPAKNPWPTSETPSRPAADADVMANAWTNTRAAARMLVLIVSIRVCCGTQSAARELQNAPRGWSIDIKNLQTLPHLFTKKRQGTRLVSGRHVAHAGARGAHGCAASLPRAGLARVSAATRGNPLTSPSLLTLSCPPPHTHKQNCVSTECTAEVAMTGQLGSEGVIGCCQLQRCPWQYHPHCHHKLTSERYDSRALPRALDHHTAVSSAYSPSHLHDATMQSTIHSSVCTSPATLHNR
jgi:hypothetical protein